MSQLGNELYSTNSYVMTSVEMTKSVAGTTKASLRLRKLPSVKVVVPTSKYEEVFSLNVFLVYYLRTLFFWNRF